MTHNTIALKRLTMNAHWAIVSSALTHRCKTWAKGKNLSVYVGDDGGQGQSTAFYTPSTGQIEINARIAFGQVDPATIGDLRDPIVLSRYPLAAGIALHEAMHAYNQHADLAKLNKELWDRGGESLMNVHTYLEETRVEGRGIIMWPKDKGYLKASSKFIYDTNKGKWSPRFAAVCLIGRAAVGVLDESEVEEVQEYLLTIPGWSTALLAIVRDTAEKFRDLNDYGPDLAEQIRLAEVLDQLMPLPADDFDEEELEEAMQGALSKAARNGSKDAVANAIKARADDEQREKDKDRKQKAKSQAIADSVFYPLKGAPRPERPELSNMRVPTVAEKTAAANLAKELKKAKYRDADLTEFRSALPPGRVSGTEIMRMSAAEYIGASTKGFEPFKRKRYEIIDEPPLSVGIMSDVSGSMIRVQPSIGSACWIIAEAVYGIADANAALVYYGNDVYPGLRKGERLPKVATWTGSAGYEQFDKGFQALDGELDLLSGSGARLLFICSDGQYRPPQVEACLKWLDKCVKSGVAVVWLDLKDKSAAQDYADKFSGGVEHVRIGTDLPAAISKIGEACVRALTAVSSGGD